ncbi:hypothetical protein [Pseudoruegeria sp. HB172150]|uniref:hypothetical protein n=1 Tax=Pseudoruegeria sp. HB172150 TaxID=2721164 RepID=UPI001C12F9AE|nr:hypothetical protein [Pseudoruegeria sp. HB172150]
MAAFLLYRLTHYLMTATNSLTPETAAMHRVLLVVILLAYALLIAVPFVPGVEIGLTMIAMGGSTMAPFVYLATVLGLSVSYGVGRWLPYRNLCRMLNDLGLKRWSGLVETIRPLSPDERLAALRTRLPHWLGPVAVRGRYLLLALLINLPGSTVIGGGGGICFMAGLTRLFLPAATLATIALAVLPLPLGVWLWWPGFIHQ